MDAEDHAIRLLGPVELRWAGTPVPLPRRQQRLLLGVLALSPNRVVPVHRLLELLWPDRPPDGGRRQVQVLVSRLRGALSRVAAGCEAAVFATGSGYGLRVDPMTVDAYRFGVLAERARAAGDDEERTVLLRQALDLWRGPALDAAATGAARDALCVGLEEARRVVVEEHVETSLRLGRHRQVLGTLAEEVAADPARERLVGLLMLALYRSGRVAEALDAFERLRERLADDLGLEPGPGVVRLRQDILRGDPGLGDRSGLPGRSGPPGRSGDLEGEGMVLLGLGRMRLAQDRYAESATAYEEALRRFERIGDRRNRAAALSGLGTVRAEAGWFGPAEDSLHEAAELFTRLGDRAGRAHARCMLGFVRRERGDGDAALSVLNEALAAFRKIDDRRGEALLHRSVGLAHRALGEHGEAAARFRDSRRLFGAAGDPHGACYADQAMAKIHLHRGDLRLAEQALFASLRVCSRLGDRFGRGLVLRTIGELRIAQGAPVRAGRALAAALALWDEMGLPLWRARTLGVLARLEATQGHAAAAEAALREASAIFLRMGSRESAGGGGGRDDRGDGPDDLDGNPVATALA
ncbi:BTAD domain-containing putative transcriptional regulator [Nonomuraea sp. NPDC050691]|uniref:BTAD domain-containing putative transcriptional regulator n=1 Tax=Nonomuraea sp. NPDC050691 TaxID=3155661 RepID=UPI0033EFF3B1